MHYPQSRHRLHCSVRLTLIFGLMFVPRAEAADVTPLPQAHAHNDYYHKRPLLDALDHGFCSVEADVFLVDGSLLVGHSAGELSAERSLQRLYLDPLRERIRRQQGHVQAPGVPFRLLIDIKSDAAATYRALDEVLADYREILTRVENDEVTEGPVQVVISGSRDQSAIAADPTRYAGIDGRLSDLGSDAPPHLLPWISDRWSTHFSWNGVREMPAEQRQKLRRIVEQAHSEGRIVRFWATPDRPSIWQELADADVDLINTDNLDGLRTFLLQHTSR